MKDKVYVWDPLIRIFHWSLVVAFVTSYLTGDENETIHIYSGYFILALLIFRLVWGVVGPKRARFSNFISAPTEAVAYVRGLFSGSAKRYTGHNPAGGWMALALLLSLSLTGLSGLKLYGVEGHGPLAVSHNEISLMVESGYDAGRYAREETEYLELDDDDHNEEYGERYEEFEEHNEGDGDEEAEEFWEEVHELFVNISLLLVFVHIAGVIFSSFRHRENLPLSMITGYKRG